MPGIPPIYAATIAYVAEKEGFFKKYGANVEIRPFDNGTAAARAVVSGDIDMALSPTPPVINQMSNAGVPLVAIYGMPNPDWVLGSTEPGKKCEDIKGQPVGVDSVGGARSVALRSMLAGCPGVKIEDVQQVALGSNSGTGDDRRATDNMPCCISTTSPLIEAQGKKLNHLLVDEEHQPDQPLPGLGGAQGQARRQPRRHSSRRSPRMIDAARFMQDPKNADKVADDGDRHRPQQGSRQGGAQGIPRRSTSGRPRTTACRQGQDRLRCRR